MSLAPASRARLGLLWLSIAFRGGGPPVRPAPRRCVARSWGGPVTRRLRAGPAPAVFHFQANVKVPAFANQLLFLLFVVVVR